MPTSQLGKADVHIHSSHSDGAADVRAILEYVSKQTELNVIAIADHDVLDGSLRARDMARRYGVEAIPAMEVTSMHGHILALFIEHPVPPGLPAAETIALIHEQNGIAIAAHVMEPFSAGLLSPRPRPMSLKAVWQTGVDALEVFNASLTFPPVEALGYIAARRLGVAATGGSDSHYLGTIGLGITLFPGHTAADFRRAVLERTTEVGGTRYAMRHYMGHIWHRRLSHTRVGTWAAHRLALAYAHNR
jgi:predicted metal-dependent phosphoesterase TrpH